MDIETFDEFMKIVIKEAGNGNISVQNVTVYLFEHLEEHFKYHQYELENRQLKTLQNC